MNLVFSNMEIIFHSARSLRSISLFRCAFIYVALLMGKIQPPQPPQPPPRS